MEYTYKELESKSTEELETIKKEQMDILIEIDAKRRNLIINIICLQNTVKAEED